MLIKRLLAKFKPSGKILGLEGQACFERDVTLITKVIWAKSIYYIKRFDWWSWKLGNLNSNYAVVGKIVEIHGKKEILKILAVWDFGEEKYKYRQHLSSNKLYYIGGQIKESTAQTLLLQCWESLNQDKV